MTQEEKYIPGRKIVNEYWADGEWHYEYKTYRYDKRRMPSG